MRTLQITNGMNTMEMSQVVAGSSDYLHLDNMEKVNQMFSTYVKLGGNTFDTARHYRQSEAVIGKWMKEHDRTKYNIITKCCHPRREARSTPRVDPANIREDLTESLKQLQTSYVDVLLLHRDNPDFPVGMLMETLSNLVDQGKVRFFGVSNWELSRVKKAVAYCREHNLHPLTFNSPNFSLATVNRPRWAASVTADQEMIDWHEENNFPLLSWSAQAEGFFAHRFKPEDAQSEDADTRDFAEVYFNDLNWNRMKVVDKLAAEKRVEPIQISLAYVLNANFPVFATIGPEEEWQLRQSFETAKIEFSDKEMKELKGGHE